MKEIDFLPHSFRVAYDRRRKTACWTVGLCATVLILSFDAAELLATKSWLRTEIDTVDRQLDQSTLRCWNLITLENQLREQTQAATLYTYLRHPWPTTLILSAIVDPLPATLKLTEFKLTVEPAGHSAGAKGRRQRGAVLDTEPDSALEPYAADLARLGVDHSDHVVRVTINGVTNQPDAVHAYIDILNDDPLIDEAELGDLTTSSQGEPDSSRFAVHVTFLPPAARALGQARLAGAPKPRDLAVRGTAP